ncbi:MAG: hypothetical protein ACLQBK_23680 [Candidatus Sulfotelmatobacter sp.]
MESTLSRFRRWAKRLVGAETTQRKTEVTVETDRITIIRRRDVIRGWCQECACEVEMVSLEDPGAITGTSPALLRGGPESRAWHLCQGADGALLVCLDSLLKSL